jgi:acetylornithine deacetylase/succinyl-diaminopimelate desuccinylase-like protein
MTVVEARGAIAEVLPSVRADLEALVRIPGVSADPAAGDAMRKSAEAVAALLEGAGLTEVEILQVAGGQPAVVGHRRIGDGVPTVLLYAHHDVQPAGPRADWDSDPYEPVERDGRLYGRGSADDKAGIALHLAVLRAYGDDLPVNVTVLVEGEEEIGSPTLAAFLAAYQDRLAADVIVLADSTNWQVGVPALTTSLRGGVNATVEVRTLHHAVHNGMYGGPVPDALTTLCRLLATLHEDDGTVAVEGLTHGDADPLDLTEEQLRADAGVVDGVQLIGRGSLTSRLWARPSVSVIALDAPPVDDAAMTLLPLARAKVTLRMGRDEDVDTATAAFVRHLESRVPWGASVSVTTGTPIEPFAAATDGPAYAAARAAFAAAWGVEPVEIGVGGSINFIASFARAFPAAEILITGVEDPDTRAHGANESLHLAEFERACVGEALLLAGLAGLADGVLGSG